MAQPARKLATYDDILGLPADARAEVIAGVLYEHASPRPRHQRVQAAFGRYVGGPFDQDDEPGGWWILVDTDVRFALHDIVRPDVVGWRRERMPHLPDDRPVDLVPDWICEIRSASTASHDVLRKRPLYAQHGVGWFWAADPEARVVESFVNRDGRWVAQGAAGDGELARLLPFDAVEIDITRLFGRL